MGTGQLEAPAHDVAKRSAGIVHVDAPNNGQSYSFFNQWLKDMKSCFVDIGLKTVADDLNPFPTDELGLPDAKDFGEKALTFLSNQRMIAAWSYGASKGLPYAAKSSIFQGVIQQASLLKTAAEAAPMVSLDVALWHAVYNEATQCY